MLRDRLELLKSLLSDEGTIFLHIDDSELGYLLVLADEIFGRANRKSIISFRQASATGHKAINPGCVNIVNFVLVYAKNAARWKPNRLYTARQRNERYNNFVVNRQQSHECWEISTLAQAFAEANGVPTKSAKKLIKDYEQKLDEFVFEHADAVVQIAYPNYEAVSQAARAAIDESKRRPSEIIHLPRDSHSDFYLVNGQRLLFYSDRLQAIDGEIAAGEPLTNLWGDILSNNLHNEGGVSFPKGKKPEALIKRCIELVTQRGDLVLDSFAGSGTTAAVAHKMRRRWISVELGEHCHTHIIPRLRKVISGEDQGGISKAVDWKGGGGFRYYRLAPSLVATDKYGNEIINPEFNREMLAEAVCKLEGFTYAPSDELYWQHGKSTDTDFIFVTTQTLTHEQLAAISEEVGNERTLLVCCAAFRGNPDGFSNLTMKKIPKAVLHKCQWDWNEYEERVKKLGYKAEQFGGLFTATEEVDAE